MKKKSLSLKKLNLTKEQVSPLNAQHIGGGIKTLDITCNTFCMDQSLCQICQSATPKCGSIDTMPCVCV